MGWKPIEQKPPHDMPVLFYFGNMVWHKPDGSTAPELPRWRQERIEVGFYHDGLWCENGTGHDVFEDWRRPEYTPTHWMTLPKEPTDTLFIKPPNETEGE